MNDIQNHWSETNVRAKNLGGRPSKVGKVLAMDLADYVHGTPAKVSMNHAARALVMWAGLKGARISLSTSKRVVSALVLRGTFEKEGVNRRGYDWKLSVKRLGL